MDVYLREKLESTPQWGNPSWCGEFTWALNKLTLRTGTLLLAQYHAQRVIESGTTHLYLVETAKAILAGALLNGYSCRWPQQPNEYLSPTHPVMAFGMAYQILCTRWTDKILTRTTEASQAVGPAELKAAKKLASSRV